MIDSRSRRQLIDSLTSHISLYNSKSSSSSSNSNPRSQILKWFSSLSVHQRRSHLTIVDQTFSELLLQMQSKLQSNGHGFFIIIPDIPSPNHLPSLCYRKSHGLLTRVSEFDESERAICESVRLFSSREGERDEGISDRGCCMDSITVSGSFVENVDGFVKVMDGVSNGRFLRGEENGLGSDWLELEWLKDKGYYSLEAFVANRLEVALRLAWLNCNVGKKRGVKLKDKAASAAAAMGVAANVYWRKKGCVDWWGKLDVTTRRKIFQTVLGKAAKSMTSDILNGRNIALEDELQIFSEGAEQPLHYNHIRWHQRNFAATRRKDELWSTRIPLALQAKSLFILREISVILLSFQHNYDEETLFFSSFGHVNTIVDRILGKLRELIMVVSLDFTKFELLEEDTLSRPMKKSKEKSVSANRKKKGKAHDMKKIVPLPRSPKDDSMFHKLAKKMFKDGGDKLANNSDIHTISSGLAGVIHDKDRKREPPSSAVDMEHGGVISGMVQCASKKSKKERKKLKNGAIGNLVETRVSETTTTNIFCPSSISEGEVLQGHHKRVSEKCDTANVGNDTFIENNEHVPNFTHSLTTQDDDSAKSVEGHYVAATTEASNVTDLNSYQSVESVGENHDTEVETVNSVDPPSLLPAVIPVVEIDNILCNQDINPTELGHIREMEAETSCISGKITGINQEEEISSIQEQDIACNHHAEIVNSSGYPSYEWPSVAPVHLPCVSSHLPAATDRLHLDVGHNWQNHFQQSFVQTVHPVRNPPIENGCSEFHTQPLPMSLDWPPMVRSVSGLVPSMACSYNTGYISRRQSFHQGFSAPSMPCSAMSIDDERLYPGDFMDSSHLPNSQELADEQDIQLITEEDFEVHALSGMDYSQYFGGGVMYWDSSDHPVNSFSRPPSLSSDDSSWAWREADMNRTVDDMVAFSSSYSTNGLASPSTASFCSPFEPLGPAHQAVGYVLPGSEVTGKVMHSSTMADVGEEKVSVALPTFPGDIEAKTGDLFPYPILRPIIIPNMSRERSRSEFKRSHDHKSPCVPPSKREEPRIKRPPSPVVLSVPRAPRPPPPSPVGDSRKHRGFPTVRSGSSSPRHWGVKGWFHEGINFDESCLRVDGSEVVLPSWRKKSLSARHLIQPLSGALLQDRLIAISHLTRDQEHPDVAIPLQPPELLNSSVHKSSLTMMHSLLHDEIDSFCKQVAGENMIRKPYINWAVKRVTRSLQVLWPRSRTNVFGSNATGLSLPTSDVDLVVCLPPVRNLEPIKEAGILEGRNGIKETCLQHAARYLANQEWVKSDSLKIVENTAIPIIMLVVEVPHDLIASVASNVQILREGIDVSGEQGISFQKAAVGSETSGSQSSSVSNTDNGKDIQSIRLDISFKAPSHTGLQTTELVKELTEQFPAATPLALVLKQFLADRSLDQSYSGGLSSYCLILLITRFLQHEHHLGRPINQNFGGLLMDFFYFFGNVFDPRRMRVSVQGSGVYIKRERGYSIDPIYIDDPLFPANNVGRNCFRIHQCIKAFADAYSILEDELSCLPDNAESNDTFSCELLPKIIPSIGLS